MSPRVRPLARRACCGNFARLAGSGRTTFHNLAPAFRDSHGFAVRATSSMIARQRAFEQRCRHRLHMTSLRDHVGLSNRCGSPRTSSEARPEVSRASAQVSSATSSRKQNPPKLLRSGLLRHLARGGRSPSALRRSQDPSSTPRLFCTNPRCMLTGHVVHQSTEESPSPGSRIVIRLQQPASSVVRLRGSLASRNNPPGV